MKISELIAELFEIQYREGDVPVIHCVIDSRGYITTDELNKEDLYFDRRIGELEILSR